ncbi:hypothetical protein [Orientia tsutsugamushi]|uniref:Uncharacterized protein n=1 Tax=Orientia tsutsugamushi TaxID=784 RepID=A0A2U3R8W9_ORITS|nr:hypothetical protein [Orientia tsutsugamushi]KJV55097.1 hypothetical protein OTSKATO_0798 [Orientia tsutsugamushi str. Kato PP]SPR09653.1 Uncharacterised protein [Orientia tsutsugamushi]
MVFESKNRLNHLLYLTFLEVRNGAKLRNFASNNCKIANNNSSNNATIFYNFIENIIPRSKSRGIVQQDNSNNENTKE